MKITKRISSGYGLLIAVLVGLVIYQVFTINYMQSTLGTLKAINFESARACLNLWPSLDPLAETTRKAFELGDPQYFDKLKVYQEDFDSKLEVLKSRAASDKEKVEVKRFEQAWDSFNVHLGQMRQLVPPGGIKVPQILEEDFELLQTQIESVFDAAKQSIKIKLDRSEKTSKMAEIVSICVAAAAFMISILIWFLIYRSISKPLINLIEGTRAIADGKFFYRLDTSRDDEFAQLAKDFNTMARRLNELDAMKKDFVSHVSHELKAPLASMHETIQLLLEQIPGPLTEKQKRLLELNLQSGERLTSMIRNLLDLSRIEAGVMEYEMKNRDLIPLVRTAIAELQGQAQEKQIQIQTILPSAPLHVECDGDRIVQVIVNLVGNAVKFSPKLGAIQIQVEAIEDFFKQIPRHVGQQFSNSEQQGNFGLVTVADSGPGVADSDKEKIFEKFHQAKQEKKIAGQGVGLGLAICRTIVQAHHGAVWVEDNPGGGSRFLLLLPPGKKEAGDLKASLPI
jgi:signal transduction histidine kinase